MVDFNNETTVAQGSSDVVKIIRLEKRYNLFEALEVYYKNKFLKLNASDDIAFVRARALNLLWEMEGELTRKHKIDKEAKQNDNTFNLEELKTKLLEGDFQQVLEGVSTLNLFLDDIGLTKIDVRRRFDSSRVEHENKERQL